MASSESIAKRWRELHGEHSWDGLLDPLHIDLRKSIISYGELAEATYDGFNTERRSPHIGACMYGYDDLLHISGAAAAGHYKVTKFIYATSSLPLPDAFLLLPLAALKDVWCRESNFMGYVAVATDEGVAALGRRDIVVAWRGTVRPLEWTNDLDVTPVPAAPVLGSSFGENPFALVHRGFLSLYTSSNANSKFNQTSARDQVLEEVRRLVELYKDEDTSITITGHSLGAALSTLNAVDIVANGANKPASNSSKPPCPVTAMVFACPHVGNNFFRSAFRSFRDLKSLHVKNFGDIVPNVPALAYVDVAVQLPINTSNSPYLHWPLMSMSLHNLELYLHGVAGEQGSAGGFKLEVERELALVNKSADVLKDEYPVPASWWVLQHKGMVKNDDGQWELKDFKHI
ncbi:phospholipase A1-II 7-like [Phragmites australis]|uniref:phospholipase A1-II 7-like n=1 Tax=Phragmites australis TaxID=29695 RepID=UPI002D797017|nr:phospholipase A1-II 7-like [Phragmites australis]